MKPIFEWNDMRLVSFPRYAPEFADTAHRYYASHFASVLGVLREAGCRIAFFEPTLSHQSSRTHFHLECGRASLLFDISDYHDTSVGAEIAQSDAVFKFHYSRALHSCYPKIFAFSPVSFHNWSEYRGLVREIEYRAKGLVLCNQTPHTQNAARRRYVRSLLRETYGPQFDGTLTTQIEFWRKIEHALISVCVPGARLDILDRGQLQYMAFGACTVSPRLSIDLPNSEPLIPDFHYLECRSDWQDLVEKIEWARTHAQQCVEIGLNAKALFARALTPEALFQWVTDSVVGLKS